MSTTGASHGPSAVHPRSDCRLGSRQPGHGHAIGAAGIVLNWDVGPTRRWVVAAAAALHMLHRAWTYLVYAERRLGTGAAPLSAAECRVVPTDLGGGSSYRSQRYRPSAVHGGCVAVILVVSYWLGCHDRRAPCHNRDDRPACGRRSRSVRQASRTSRAFRRVVGSWRSASPRLDR
jgi:hypothetical protein